MRVSVVTIFSMRWRRVMVDDWLREKNRIMIAYLQTLFSIIFQLNQKLAFKGNDGRRLDE
jgi:hypothetical protein